jgi:para-nitrobenzyl esterase
MEPRSSGSARLNTQVVTTNGILEGAAEPESGIRAFRGIPFAAPPVGDLRWKPPQPMTNWEGIRQASRFGPRAMQLPIFGDMNFRLSGMSEDCLYLNVWAPDGPGTEPLPVLVYFYGGGNVAGDGSEPRYDGASLARKGIIVITVNYRLNVFGFLAHPELTQESPHGASGNYGYLDQVAALRWVRDNIAAFGGDPARVTIAGESAGSIAVSALMVSPLAKDLIAGAIGSSGSIMGALPPVPMAEAESNGATFAAGLGARSLAELRAIPAERLLEATAHADAPRFTATLDGYFLPRHPVDMFTSGAQAQVPLLVGWNSEEMSYPWLMGDKTPTSENFRKVVQERFGNDANELLHLYPASTNEEAEQSATDLSGDAFTAYSTWKWADTHATTSGQPVYRYLYAHPRPPMRPELGDAVAGLAGGVMRGSDAEAKRPPAARGAVHSADIEYFMGNLATNHVYAWTADDYELSERMQAHYANFVRTGDPNGPGLPAWPPARRDGAVHVMHLDVETGVMPERHRERYLLLDRILSTREQA